MIPKSNLLAYSVLTAVLAAQVASAQFVTNTVTVRNIKGLGVNVNYTGPTYNTAYDKVQLRCDQTTGANKVWLGWNLASVWNLYGQANLVDASFTWWGENGTSRTFSVAALNDSAGLDGWFQSIINWNNAPGNSATQSWPGTAADNAAFDWSKCHGGTYIWAVSGGNNALTADLARTDLGTSYDQCSRYACINATSKSNLVAWLKTDTDGLVTLMASALSGNQNWWIGTNGQYANDISLGYTSTNTANGTFGDVIRDSPTLTLTFVTPAGPPAAPVFTNITRQGDNLILQGSNGVPQGAYQMLRSPNLSAPLNNWLGLGIQSFDAGGNFSFTSGIPSENPENFYRLLVLSSGPVFSPGITTQPQDLAIAVGTAANFSVVTTGTAPLTYRWYFNTNTLLQSGLSAALTIPNAQVANSGKISVTVSNLVGITNSVFATLTVTNPPLPVAPTGLTATAGILQVSLSWNAVSGATSYIVKRSTVNGSGYVNIVTNATTSYLNTGLVNGTTYYYVVSAVNATGEGANSGQASATPVNASPVTVANFGFETPVTGNYIYNPGGASWTFSSGSGVTANNSTFTSGIPDAPQGVQVGFLKGLGTLSQTISGFVPGVTYVITFAAANRGGSYPIKQTWDVQIDGVTQATFANVPTSYADYTASFTATSASHLLTFVGRVNADATVFLDNVRIAFPSQSPGIVTQPASLTRSIGSTAQFSVLANGALPLSYQWYYNTNTVLAGQTGGTLTLNNVQPANAGKYSVTVTNVNGSITSAFATLAVTADPPTITGQPVNLGRAIGQTAEFSVTASGALPQSYQWYFNTNTLLAGETNLTLTLFNVGTNQAGKYSLFATNAYGSTNSTFATLTVTNAPLAFPEAEGYGKYATGGRGGAVYEVTTLNPTGTGSFGAAITATGVRTVVFRVAGTITGNFNINRDNITIAGQTAPGDGICIKGSLSVSANNVIIRYLRVRLDTATSPESDTVGTRGYQNIILDHVSASWSGDEVMSFYQNSHVTLQWCMITEACAKFLDLTNNTGHQFGGIWGNNYGTYHHNLIAHNVSRNPRWASGCKYNDYRNNVIYNWDYESCYGGEAVQTGAEATWNFTTINMVANYYKYGPATDSGVRSRIANPSARSVDDKGSWYIAENYVNGYPTVTANNWLGVAGSDYIALGAPWSAMPINQQTPADAYTAVLAHVGCSKPNRDSVDTRIINEVATGTATYGNNGIINTAAEVGGWPTLASGTPPTDTDHDGMPDAWETAHSLNPNNAADRNSFTLNPVYTNLEVYLNELGAF